MKEKSPVLRAAAWIGIAALMSMVLPASAQIADLTGTGFIHIADSTWPGYSALTISDDVEGLSHAWHSADSRQGEDFPHWILIDFDDDRHVVTALRMLPYYDGAGLRLKDFYFEGSDDNVSYTPLHAGILQCDPAHVWQEFLLANDRAYRYYRLRGLNNWTTDALTRTQMIIEEWEMGGFVSPVPGGVPAGAQRLAQNTPNPFNPATRIDFEVASTGPAHLAVYDLQGRLIDVLVGGPHLEAGHYEVHWLGTARNGSSVPSGVYLCRLVTAEGTASIRMTLVR